MPLISFVFSSWIINEYYKYIYIYIWNDVIDIFTSEDMENTSLIIF